MKFSTNQSKCTTVCLYSPLSLPIILRKFEGGGGGGGRGGSTGVGGSATGVSVGRGVVPEAATFVEVGVSTGVASGSAIGVLTGVASGAGVAHLIQHA